MFLNYSAPINVYSFETLIAHWIFDKPIPEWEEDAQKIDHYLYYSVNHTIIIFIRLTLRNE
jgi:hypothetical protein